MSSSETPLKSAEHALGLIRDGMVVGLGSGRASTAFVRALGDRVHRGLQIRGVATSTATEELARSLRIPLTDLESVAGIDVAVDGADEVDPALNLIKGFGGALVREKVVAAAARQFVVLVGADKLTPTLGSRGIIPVEVIPFALGFCRHRLDALGLPSEPRSLGGRPFRTDNGNVILDATTGPISDPAGLEAALRAIPGVVGTGLFIGMRPTVVVQDGDAVRVLAPQ